MKWVNRHRRSTIAAIVLAAGTLTMPGTPGATAAENPDPTSTIVVLVGAGSYFSLAVRDDGTLWAWGQNSDGQLGDGTTRNRRTPVQVPGLTDVISVSGGGDHTLAVRSNGTVWAWGDNQSGQLGDGTIFDRRTPGRVTGLPRVVEVVAGSAHSLARTADGELWTWGEDGYQGWDEHLKPVRVSDMPPVTSMAAGYGHSLATAADGTVWGWGANTYGQLGLGDGPGSETPVEVLVDTDIASVDAKEYGSLALQSDGTAWEWGLYAPRVPTEVRPLAPMSDIAVGSDHRLAVRTSDGALRAWGMNDKGQLGDGTTRDRRSPVAVERLTAIKAAESGSWHNLAIDDDGGVWAWGSNRRGQVGDGSPNFMRKRPVQVVGLDLPSAGPRPG